MSSELLLGGTVSISFEWLLTCLVQILIKTCFDTLYEPTRGSGPVLRPDIQGLSLILGPYIKLAHYFSAFFDPEINARIFYDTVEIFVLN